MQGGMLFMNGFLSRSIFLLLAFARSASAESGCPPGQYPQQGQGWQSCVPIAGYSQEGRQERSAPVWADRWQTIATDSARGVLGTSTNALTQAQAEAEALSTCRSKGGRDCLVQVDSHNGCVAMTVGKTVMNFTNGATKSEAEGKGIDLCRKEDTDCQNYYSACSSAVRTH